MKTVSIWLLCAVSFLTCLSLSALVYGSHITDAYSMPERTRVTYASFLQLTGAPLRLRLTNPSFLAALAAT